MILNTSRNELWVSLILVLSLVLKTSASLTGKGACVRPEDVTCPTGEPLGGNLSLDCTGDDYMISYDTKIDSLYQLLIYAECSVSCNNHQKAGIYYYDLTDVKLHMSNLKGTINGSYINLPRTTESTTCRVFGCFNYYVTSIGVYTYKLFSPVHCNPVNGATLPGFSVNTTDQPSQHTLMENSSSDATDDIASQYMYIEYNTSGLPTLNSTNEGVVLIVTAISLPLLAASIIVVVLIIVTRRRISCLEKHNLKKVKYPCYTNEVLLTNCDVKVDLDINSISKKKVILTPTNSQMSIFDDLYQCSPDDPVPGALESSFMNNKYRSFVEGMPSERYFTSSLKNIVDISEDTTEQQIDQKWLKLLRHESRHKLRSHDNSSLQTLSRSSADSGYLPIRDDNNMVDSSGKSQPCQYVSVEFNKMSSRVESCDQSNSDATTTRHMVAYPELSLEENSLHLSSTTSVCSGETDSTPALDEISDGSTTQELNTPAIPEPDRTSNNSRLFITSDSYVQDCTSHERLKFSNQTYMAESVPPPTELSSSDDFSIHTTNIPFPTGSKETTSSVVVAFPQEVTPPVASHYCSEHSKTIISEDGYVANGINHERQYSSIATLVPSPFKPAVVDLEYVPSEAATDEELSSEEFYFSSGSDQLSGIPKSESDDETSCPLNEELQEQCNMQPKQNESDIVSFHDARDTMDYVKETTIGMTLMLIDRVEYPISYNDLDLGKKCEPEDCGQIQMPDDPSCNNKFDMKTLTEDGTYTEPENECDMTDENQSSFSTNGLMSPADLSVFDYDISQTAPSSNSMTSGNTVQFKYPSGYIKVAPAIDTHSTEYQNITDISDCEFYFKSKASIHCTGLLDEESRDDSMEDCQPSHFVNLYTSSLMDQDFSICDFKALNNAPTDLNSVDYTVEGQESERPINQTYIYLGND